MMVRILQLDERGHHAQGKRSKKLGEHKHSQYPTSI